jgi:hypothetical protein
VTPSQIKRLAKLEARQPEPLDDGAALAAVMAQIEIIGIRRRSEPGWRPPTGAESAAILRRVEEAAVRHGMTPAA